MQVECYLDRWPRPNKILNPEYADALGDELLALQAASAVELIITGVPMAMSDTRFIKQIEIPTIHGPSRYKPTGRIPFTAPGRKH